MTQELYSDGLVTITEDEITFHKYYLNGNDKTVPIEDIERITIKKPTVWSGKYRIWGTGNIKTWFPQDNDRSRRDRIFVADLKSQWNNIGFTVVESNDVEAILRRMGLI